VPEVVESNSEPGVTAPSRLTLGPTAAAEALGISRVALWKATRSGRVEQLASGAYDVEACRAALEKNSQPKNAKAGRSQKGHLARVAQVEQDRDAAPPRIDFDLPPAADSMAEAARRLEWLKLREKELKVDREEGRLVPLAEVNAHVAGMIMTARDELMRIPREEAGSLAQTTDPIRCEEIVAGRICRVLDKLTEFKRAA